MSDADRAKLAEKVLDIAVMMAPETQLKIADLIIAEMEAARAGAVEESKKVILDLAEAAEWLGTVAGVLPCDCPGEDDCLPDCPFGDSAKMLREKVYPHRPFYEALLKPSSPPATKKREGKGRVGDCATHDGMHEKKANCLRWKEFVE